MRARGVAVAVTIGATVGLVVAWLLPWMADSSVFPLVGHGFTMTSWFDADAPGLGTAVLMVLHLAAGVVAVTCALIGLRTADPIGNWLAVAAGLLSAGFAVLVARHPHPGLTSGAGAWLAVAMAALLTGSQVVVAVRGGRLADVRLVPAVAGGLVVALAGVAAWSGGTASIRDVDATTAPDAAANWTVSVRVDTLSGVSVRDAATGAEQWHHYERGWRNPVAVRSADGRTVFLTVDTPAGFDLISFAAATGESRWVQQLAPGTWPGPISQLPLSHFLRLTPAGATGVLLDAQGNELHYVNGGDGQGWTFPVPTGCGLLAGGGRWAVFLVLDCAGTARVLGYTTNDIQLWDTTVFPSIADGLTATVTDTRSTVTVTVGGLTATLNAGTGQQE